MAGQADVRNGQAGGSDATQASKRAAEPAESVVDPANPAELQARYERLLAQNTSMAVNLGRLRQELERRKAEAASATDAAERENKRFESEIKARFEEIARLTEMLEERREAADARIAELQQRHDDVVAYAAQLEHAHLSMLESTSWKLTAPVRALVRVLARHPKPQRFRARFLNYGE
ncbi:hypothetical protein DRV85_11630 [Rhodosalinus halophilus]|uniref:Uncharacterized protein n=1 Tax=Rhodosalinus halophilus TaxID=2259333 RepID=A0A365U7F8_9RHOB|nr:hypothetical protein [Rhodosalinus halophilus]RBI84598.1 hypothetical protein DRV85_11630 [Rhodosalinus halophilus]